MMSLHGSILRAGDVFAV